jgi:hypothetical protein
MTLAERLRTLVRNADAGAGQISAEYYLRMGASDARLIVRLIDAAREGWVRLNKIPQPKDADVEAEVYLYSALQAIDPKETL